jgi:nucleotide-binding universal stress UspA family protein
MAGTIVVGVDGSPASNAALRFGAEEAELRGWKLVAVHAWVYMPPPALAEPGLVPVPAVDISGERETIRGAAQAELDAALAEVFPQGPPVEIEGKLVEDDPAIALEREAKDAGLVVVGSRGRSGIAAVILGSVSRHVVDHAPCPVVVVKPSST